MQLTELKEIIEDQQDQTFVLKNAIEREVFSELMSHTNHLQVIIIMGVRRCGKSTLLQQLRYHQSEKNYYFNFDDDRLAHFKLDDFQRLLEAFYELYGEQKTFYFDEIQNIPEWERFVRRLHDQGNKIYITGSNASMFSRELGTRLTGRYLSISVYPFSFREFAIFFDPSILTIKGYSTKDKVRLRQLFQLYREKGGFPEYLQMEKKEYLHSLYENILYKDIIVRHKLTGEKVIKSLSHYLASNVAKDVSFNALKKILNVGNASTISDYCSYLESSFLNFMISRYSPSLKQQLVYSKKSYFIDVALAKMVGFYPADDWGRLLENIVFLSLLRENSDLYFHRSKRECDFIVRKNNKIIMAIQVCATLENENTRAREIEGLLEAMQEYHLSQGFILIAEGDENEETIEQNGKSFTVRTIFIGKWLLEKRHPYTGAKHRGF